MSSYSDSESPAVDFGDALEVIVREVLRQGVTVIVGSGWSVGKGLPSMEELSDSLIDNVEAEQGFSSLSDQDLETWAQVKAAISSGINFEAALDSIRTDGPLLWLVETAIAKALRPAERAAINSIVAESTGFDDMSRLLRHLSGTGDLLDVVTTNYDRLIEYSARTVGLHVDDAFAGRYIGELNSDLAAREQLSSPATRRGHGTRVRPHVRLAKPHGSLDWVKIDSGQVVRVEEAIAGRTQIVSPGLSKLQRGYEIEFAAHRNRANSAIENATSLLFIGYGFNDSHLQQHVDRALRMGRPALLLTRDLTDASTTYLDQFVGMSAIYRTSAEGGSTLRFGQECSHIADTDLWSLDTFLSSVYKV